VPNEIDINFRWRSSNEPDDIFALRVKTYVIGLGEIDPHFTHLGISKAKGPIETMPDDQLCQYAIKNFANWSVGTLSRELSYNDEPVRIHVSPGRHSEEFPDVGHHSSIGIIFDQSIALTKDENLLRQIYEYSLDYWSAEEAIIYRWDPDRTQGDRQFVWLYWLRQGSSQFINPRVFAPIDDPEMMEDWRGGILKTWPQWAPWKALPES
jgi:hypothetical protein